jgi:hypothetical protein
MNRWVGVRTRAEYAVILGSGLTMCLALSGCLVACYSSQGGWWVWPGSLVVTLVLALVWLLSRR